MVEDFLEGRDIDSSVKVRWIVLSQRWPVLLEELEKHPEIFDSFEEYTGSRRDEVLKILQNKEVKEIFYGLNDDKTITKQDVLAILGHSHKEHPHHSTIPLSALTCKGIVKVDGGRMSGRIATIYQFLAA